MAKIPTPGEAPVKAPLKKPTKSTELGKIVARLFASLQIENPNQIKNLEDFFEKTDYNGTEGLLTHIEDKVGPLDISHIEQEEIPLFDQETLKKISKTLNTVTNGTTPDIGKKINELMIWCICDKIEHAIHTKLPSAFATKITDFRTTVIGGGISDIGTLMNKTKGWLDNDDDLKKKNILDKITLTNKEIQDALIGGTPTTSTILGITPLTPIGATLTPAQLSETSDSRDTNAKKCMDALLSLELSKPLHENIEAIYALVSNIQQTFSNTFPMISCIFAEYPFDTQTLIPTGDPLYVTLQKYQHQYRITDKNAAYDEATKQKKFNEIKVKLDELYRQAYLNNMESSEPLLAQALKEIGEKNFNFSTVDPTKVQHFFDWIASHPNTANLKEIMNIFHIEDVDTAGFLTFYRDILNLSKNTIDFPGPPSITLTVTKKLKDLNTKPTDLYDKNSPLHTLPIVYELNPEEFNQFEIADRAAIQKLFERHIQENGKIVLEGDKVGRLIYLYFLNRNKGETAITALDTKVEENLKAAIGNPNTPDHPTLENLNESDLTPKEKFMEERNKIKGYSFKEEDNGFRRGTTLIAAIGDTQIPPKENGGKQWIQMEIEDIDEKSDPATFSVEIHGVEISMGKFEKTSQKLHMTKKQIEDLGQFGGVYKLPDIKSTDDPIKHLEKFKEANKNGMEFKGINAFEDLGWDKEHFTKDFTGEGKKEPVEYFGYQDTTYDEKGGTHKENIMYAVKHNPERKTFTLTGEFNDYTEKDPITKKAPKHYTLDKKHEMDYNAFMMFISEKGLKPRKKESAEQLKADQQQENMKLFNEKNFKIKRFSIKSIVGGIKAKWKQLNEKMDERTKAQQKQFEDWLVDDLGIWNLLDNTLGRIPGIGEATGNLQLDRYNERDKEVRAKIEKWLKIFESDPDFGTTFPETPPHVRRLFKGMSYKEFLIGTDDFKVEQTAHGLKFGNITQLKGEDLHKGAALLLANISKGKGMYRGLSEYENSGLWVAKLLGQEHWKNFMKRKYELMAEINTNKRDTDRLREELAKCEIDYILNQVRGSNPAKNGIRFGSYESRGEFPEGKPEYIDNPSKKALSNAFADKLDETYKNRNTQSNIDSIVQTLPNNFGIAKAEFESKLKSSRFPVAMANLKKMHTLMRTDEEKRIVEGCVVTVLLSGEMNTNPKEETIKRFATLEKTAGLIPGFAVKYADHPTRVLHLLNKATKDTNKFGDELKVGDKKYNPSDFGPGSQKVAVDDLIKGVNARRSRDNANRVHKFFDGELRNKTRDKSPDNDPILKDFHDALFSNDIDLTDNDMLKNDDGINLQGINANKNVARNRMEYRNGEFEGKDGDERSAKQSFWEKVNNQLNNGQVSSEVAMRKFLSRFESKGFQESDKERIVGALKAAKYYKGKGGMKNSFQSTKDPNLSYDMGKIENNDRQKILWRTFKGQVIQGGNGKPPTAFDNAISGFFNIFKDNIEEIASDDFITRVFGNQYNDTKASKLIGWNRYNYVVGKDNESYFEDIADANETNPNKKAENERKRRDRRFFTDNPKIFINKRMKDTEKAIEKYYSTTKYKLGKEENEDDYIEVAN